MFDNLNSNKIYYTKILENEIMPKIKLITNQKNLGFHGLEHTEMVGLLTIEYALSLNENPIPAMISAGLHDCARTNDRYDEMHGPNCEQKAKQFLWEYRKEFNISSNEEKQIIYAVINHTTGEIAPDYISACLWDADRTRLSWLWGYNEKFFNTQKAKEIASLTTDKIKLYIEDWNKLILKNNIPTINGKIKSPIKNK